MFLRSLRRRRQQNTMSPTAPATRRTTTTAMAMTTPSETPVAVNSTPGTTLLDVGALAISQIYRRTLGCNVKMLEVENMTGLKKCKQKERSLARKQCGVRKFITICAYLRRSGAGFMRHLQFSRNTWFQTGECRLRSM